MQLLLYNYPQHNNATIILLGHRYR